MKFLIVVDMQNDFITGSLGSADAQRIVPNVLEAVKKFDGKVIFTKDTHDENYMETREGRRLPVSHCIKGTQGFEICSDLLPYAKTIIEKETFGSCNLPDFIRELDENPEEIVLMGLCTDICIISNAFVLKAAFPECDIKVNASCSAGVTQKSHETALSAMRAVQIDIIE